MPDLPIPAEAIEVAAKAIRAAHIRKCGTWQVAVSEFYSEAAEAVIDALRMEVERSPLWERGRETRASDPPAGSRGWTKVDEQQRLVSRWFPVKP